MPILALSTNPNISAWETSTTNVNLLVDGVPLTGVAAAAYLYGQALTTVRFENTLDGVQLADGRFQFPPAPAPVSGPDTRQWVSLTDVANALHYKYGVDPLIEFSPGLGSRGYSIPDVNRILELLNREFSGQFSLPLIASAAVLAATRTTFDKERTAAGSGATYNASAVANLLTTASTNLLTPATSAELHDNLTEGGDIYVDRNGAFYINGVRTRAMDLAVTSRVLVQENLSAEYKEMMDDLAERNNLIGAARTVIGSGLASLRGKLTTLAQQYGMTDVLAELTAGQYSDRQAPLKPISTDLAADSVRFDIDPGWSTGTLVTVSSTGGGLTTGRDYYVFSVGSGVYRFYESQAKATTGTTNGLVNLTASIAASVSDLNPIDEADFTSITALLNTLISNKVRDGDLDQAKLQSITGQLQNNTEAMTALIKAFSDLNASLVQALR